jgi:hypothetical protein
MSKKMQTRLLAVSFGAILTFTAITAIGWVTARLAPESAVAAPLR